MDPLGEKRHGRRCEGEWVPHPVDEEREQCLVEGERVRSGDALGNQEGGVSRGLGEHRHDVVEEATEDGGDSGLVVEQREVDTGEEAVAEAGAEVVHVGEVGVDDGRGDAGLAGHRAQCQPGQSAVEHAVGSIEEQAGGDVSAGTTFALLGCHASMISSLFVQRSNISVSRATRLFVVLVLAAITLICGAFLVAGVPIPEWFVIAGRWLPVLVVLVVLRTHPLLGGWKHWLGLRPGSWVRLLTGGMVAVGVLLAAYVLSATAVIALGLADLQPWAVLGQVAVLMVPTILVMSLSTVGEEAAWRGFLQRAWSGWGFWPSTMAVSAVWMAFHVPLHGVMALQETIPWIAAITSTIGLFPLGLLLGAAAARFGSVWPAVFAHALPLTALTLLADAGSLPGATHWIVTAITAAFVTGAAILLAPRVSGKP